MMTKKNREIKKSTLRYFARYSGLAFEMLGIIFFGTFAGVKLDEKRAGEFPLFTTILSLLSVFISLYLVLKSLLRK